VRDGDEWVIDGQKMFTTNAHVVKYVFLLTRTHRDVPNHRGLTTFLVPLDSPGVEIQAVQTLSGERTNITFYSGVRLDDSWRIGDVDRGWQSLMIALRTSTPPATAVTSDDCSSRRRVGPARRQTTTGASASTIRTCAPGSLERPPSSR